MVGKGRRRRQRTSRQQRARPSQTALGAVANRVWRERGEKGARALPDQARHKPPSSVRCGTIHERNPEVTPRQDFPAVDHTGPSGKPYMPCGGGGEERDNMILWFWPMVRQYLRFYVCPYPWAPNLSYIHRPRTDKLVLFWSKPVGADSRGQHYGSSRNHPTAPDLPVLLVSLPEQTAGTSPLAAALHQPDSFPQRHLIRRQDGAA